MPFTRIAPFANLGHLTSEFMSDQELACEAWCTCKHTGTGKGAAANDMFNPWQSVSEKLQRVYAWGSLKTGAIKRKGRGDAVESVDVPANDGTLIANYIL